MFHLAAMIKFNQALNAILNTNVDGTEHVLSVCKDMKNIKVNEHLMVQ